MTQLIIGSFLISLLHAVIPNHWLPVLAIGRKEGWSLAETSRVTFIAGMAHVISTVIIGILLGMIGSELIHYIDHFAHVIGPSVLILVGLYFVRQHYKHHHFHLDKIQVAKKKQKRNHSCINHCYVPFALYGNRGLFSFSRKQWMVCVGCYCSYVFYYHYCRNADMGTNSI